MAWRVRLVQSCAGGVDSVHSLNPVLKLSMTCKNEGASTKHGSAPEHQSASMFQTMGRRAPGSEHLWLLISPEFQFHKAWPKDAMTKCTCPHPETETPPGYLFAPSARHPSPLSPLSFVRSCFSNAMARGPS
ncbi:hypothetical protein P885DRAFT_60412 [Corynascus similis CBS 632.67]